MKVVLNITAASRNVEMGNCPLSLEWTCGIMYRTS